MKISTIPSTVRIATILPAKRVNYIAKEFSGSVEQLKTLAQVMIKTCMKADGVGLSATQIGINNKVFIIRDKTDSFKVFVNPDWIKTDDAKVVQGPESCLSVPGVTLTVPRWDQIKGTWLSLDATEENLVQETSVLLVHPDSRVFQHEFDHLLGVSILDRAVLNREQRRNLSS